MSLYRHLLKQQHIRIKIQWLKKLIRLLALFKSFSFNLASLSLASGSISGNELGSTFGLLMSGFKTCWLNSFKSSFCFVLVQHRGTCWHQLSNGDQQGEQQHEV